MLVKKLFEKKWKTKQVFECSQPAHPLCYKWQAWEPKRECKLIMSYNYYFDDDGDNGYVDDNDDIDGEKRENSIFIKKGFN